MSVQKWFVGVKRKIRRRSSILCPRCDRIRVGLLCWRPLLRLRERRCLEHLDAQDRGCVPDGREPFVFGASVDLQIAWGLIRSRDRCGLI
jgi:hypothetical protein